MSDPMTNAEVEDILSSIRRLVSEEERTPAQKDAQDRGGSDRLVLTPSLKVQQPVVETQTDAMDMLEASATADAMTGEAAQDDAPGDEPAELSDTAAEIAETEPTFATQRLDEHDRDQPDDDIEEAPMASDVDLEEDPAEDLAHDAVSSVVAEERAEEEDSAKDELVAEAPFVHAEPTDIMQFWQDDTDAEAEGAQRETAAGTSSLREKVAALEALVGRTGVDDDYVEEDEDEPGEIAHEGDVAKSAYQAVAEELALASEIETLDAALDDTSEPPETSADAMGHVADPAEAVADQMSIETEALDAATDASSLDDASEQAEMPHPDNAEQFDEEEGAEDLILDEAHLRELVTEIVRQELQGALGERITRNVRKLVRREIHRAFAAQDLD